MKQDLTVVDVTEAIFGEDDRTSTTSVHDCHDNFVFILRLIYQKTCGITMKTRCSILVFQVLLTLFKGVEVDDGNKEMYEANVEEIPPPYSREEPPPPYSGEEPLSPYSREEPPPPYSGKEPLSPYAETSLV
ncbi:uncharacterized protein LOC144655097 [Oculina patagonica]